MLFIETIKIGNKIENLRFHNERLNRTRKIFFNAKPIDLKNFVKIKKNFRARITYKKEILKIEYFPLSKREFKKFKIVDSNINYRFKFENRAKLNALKPENYDEIIIVKNGLITDTTISNLAFFNGKEWLTPKYPLLKGTKRAELLEKNFLKEANIKKSDLKYFKKMAMINAILGFYEIENFSLDF